MDFAASRVYYGSNVHQYHLPVFANEYTHVGIVSGIMKVLRGDPELPAHLLQPTLVAFAVADERAEKLGCVDDPYACIWRRAWKQEAQVAKWSLDIFTEVTVMRQPDSSGYKRYLRT